MEQGSQTRALSRDALLIVTAVVNAERRPVASIFGVEEYAQPNLLSVSCLVYLSTFQKEAIFSSETSGVCPNFTHKTVVFLWNILCLLLLHFTENNFTSIPEYYVQEDT